MNLKLVKNPKFKKKKTYTSDEKRKNFAEFYKLANKYYKDPTLWWIIAQANGIKGFTALNSENFKGQLRIPTEIQSILNEFSLMNR